MLFLTQKLKEMGKRKFKDVVSWRTVYNLIKDIRSQITAPVDTDGLSQLPDFQASQDVFRFQTLVGVMLSSQTKDQITSQAMKRLQEYGCTIENIIQIDEAELAQIIKPVGFYNRKAKYIKQTAQILKNDYGGDVPNDYKKILKFPGVGQKMATLFLQIAYQEKAVGISVDTHVHRITNILGWVDTKNPNETKKALEE